MLGNLGEKLEEKAMISFLKRFDANPFKVKFKDNEYIIGEGAPLFTVDMKEPIPASKLVASTSIALGEAYMDGNLEIEGDLYFALNHFLGQMDQFSTAGDVLSKLTHNPLTKNIKPKKCRAITTLAMISIPSGLMKRCNIPALTLNTQMTHSTKHK